MISLVNSDRLVNIGLIKLASQSAKTRKTGQGQDNKSLTC